MKSSLQGLVAATYTPLNEQGELNLSVIPDLVEHLLSQGISGLYVCGSTGEGMSLTSAERRSVAEAYVSATAQRVPVIIQVGHNSVTEAKELAEHAQAINADIISATCPSYFKVTSVKQLIQCMAEIAGGAPELPFYYYHIPALTGSTLDMVQFLQEGRKQIPNLTGLKYTDTKLHEFLECMEIEDGRFDVVWGCDEMLLGAIATGAQAAIGSTYNVAAPLYTRIIQAFEKHDLKGARELQSLSVKMIRTLAQYPFHSAMKAVLEMNGFAVNQCRLPQEKLNAEEVAQLTSQLTEIGFFEWSQE